MLINMREMLEVAKENRFAVGAFNISDANIFKAVVEQAEVSHSPAIIAIHPDELSFITPEFCEYIIARISKSKVPFVLHLDHGGSSEDVVKAIQAGFTSVMIDGSLLSYEENITITKNVVNIAQSVNVSVEGELGTIGNTGNSVEGGVSKITYTDPEQAFDFISRTGIDSLAIAIGTAHGIYPKDIKPELQLNILREIEKKVTIPLVLHGGSSNPDEEISEAVTIGVQKVNISSDIKAAFFSKCHEILDSGKMWEPNVIFPTCISATKKVVLEKMTLFGSINKSVLYEQVKRGE